MSVRLTTRDGITSNVALYDSVTGIAFGPLFESEDDADDFLTHLETIGERDPRIIAAAELCELAREFLDDRDAA